MLVISPENHEPRPILDFQQILFHRPSNFHRTIDPPSISRIISGKPKGVDTLDHERFFLGASIREPVQQPHFILCYMQVIR